MDKMTIIIIAVVIVAIIVILLMLKKPAPASDGELAQVAAALEEPGNPKRDCRRICDVLVRHRPILFGGRLKAKGKCMTDCGQGIDVTTRSY